MQCMMFLAHIWKNVMFCRDVLRSPLRHQGNHAWMYGWWILTLPRADITSAIEWLKLDYFHFEVASILSFCPWVWLRRPSSPLKYIPRIDIPPVEWFEFGPSKWRLFCSPRMEDIHRFRVYIPRARMMTSTFWRSTLQNQAFFQSTQGYIHTNIHYITSHHITSHHITSHHITLHYIHYTHTY